MTTSIEDGFGSRIFVRGFLLNNQLTDFSFTPRAQGPDGQVAAGGAPIANRVQPGKRPLSSMSPTLVFDRGGGQLVASLGSPGGTWITSYLVKTLVGLLDWQLDAQQAIALPNFGSRNGPTELEADRFEPSLVQALQARGHAVVQIPMTSGLQAIAAARPASPRSGIRWIGGADPRREGIAIGD
jgi:gamma-glutamyltranspeptidase/glutathione hydrolase